MSEGAELSKKVAHTEGWVVYIALVEEERPDDSRKILTSRNLHPAPRFKQIASEACKIFSATGAEIEVNSTLSAGHLRCSEPTFGLFRESGDTRAGL